ncbi:MAG: hypothetical protein DCF25_10120 [Leptolyngbya foveolarum]|uniref:Uncharacterized protein n=1 Tax=Leptolyngbya foveolarum TaxID=47253 RepID=A0A2W4UA54_9CYAN|nr:MAG: hypothetical protein DCF25_10120 [Leptolyngbya foveolarum]
MSEKVNPLLGRAAELNEYATSDLSVEESLAGGASVDDLIAAGVLYDDYDPENNSKYCFTPEETLEEIPDGPPLPEEEFQVLLNFSFRHSSKTRKKSNRSRTWT